MGAIHPNAIPFDVLQEIAALAPKPKPRPTRSAPKRSDLTTATALSRARQYLEKIDPAVSGQAGHDATYRAASKLVVGFDLSPEEAYPLLAEWNERCDPPWDEEDLWRKLREADATATQPRGALASARNEVLTHQLGGGGSSGAVPILANYVSVEVQEGEKTRTIQQGLSSSQILADLYSLTDGWPRRIGTRLFVPREDPTSPPMYLENANALFGWIAGRTERDSPIEWGRGNSCVSRSEFFEYLRQRAHGYAHMERYPHWPEMPAHYYLHPCLPMPTGSHLLWLLNRFSPASDLDGDLILAFLLTLVWGGPAGARPAFLVTADENQSGGGRGFGKSTLLEIGFELVGGAIALESNADFEEVRSRLLSRDGLGKRCLLLDNLKTLRYSCAGMEALITSSEISGRALYIGEASRPNNVTIGITVNGANLSKDMAQRCVIIKVSRAAYKSNWLGETREYIHHHRWAILADLIHILKGTERPLESYSRWAEWEGAVLSKVLDPDGCRNLITQRQEECDADEQATAEAVEAIRSWLISKGRDPDTQAVAIKSKDLAEILTEVSGERLSTQKISGWIRQRSISQLQFYRHRTKGRAWIWREESVSAETTIIDTQGFSFFSEDNLDI